MGGACRPGGTVVLPSQDFGTVRTKKEPIETPSLPPGLFQTIVADPPWDVMTGPSWGSGGKARPLVYPAMELDAIKELPVRGHVADDAHLYLWTINAYLDDAYEVAEAWGFVPSTVLVWCKPPHGIGLGGTYVLTTEYVLFARRGSLPARRRVDTDLVHVAPTGPLGQALTSSSRWSRTCRPGMTPHAWRCSRGDRVPGG